MPKKQNQGLIVPPGFSLELIVNRCLPEQGARNHSTLDPQPGLPPSPLESHCKLKSTYSGPRQARRGGCKLLASQIADLVP